MSLFDFIFSKSCQKCNEKTRECLIDNKENNNKEIWLCRVHLIEEFERSLKDYPYSIIFDQPQDGFNSYSFYPTKELQDFGDLPIGRVYAPQFSDADHIAIKDLIESISLHKCLNCSSNADSLYLVQKETKWVLRDPSVESDWNDYKENEKYYFCRNHAFEKIKYPLINNKRSFSSGIFLPYNGDGIYLNAWL